MHRQEQSPVAFSLAGLCSHQLRRWNRSLMVILVWCPREHLQRLWSFVCQAWSNDRGGNCKRMCPLSSWEVHPSLGSNTNPWTVPQVPFARSASIAMFRITITFMPMASSTLIIRLFVASSFSLAVASFVFGLGTSPVSLIVSSAKMTYFWFPEVQQCFVSAAEFHMSFVALRGMMSVMSHQGVIVKSGISHAGFVRTSFWTSATSSSVHSPTLSLLKIPIHMLWQCRQHLPLS